MDIKDKARILKSAVNGATTFAEAEQKKALAGILDLHKVAPALRDAILADVGEAGILNASACRQVCITAGIMKPKDSALARALADLTK